MTGTLLDLDLTANEDPLYADSTANLALVASNHHGIEIELASVVIELPLGAGATDLTDAVDAIRPQQPDCWQSAHDPGSAEFTFTPRRGGTVPVDAGGLAFSLDGVPVNDQVGTTSPITVTETAAFKGDGPVARTWQTTLTKGPSGFYLSDLVADPDPVFLHGQTTLSWTGSAGPDYTLERSDRPNDGAVQVGNTGPYPAEDVSEAPLVKFTLRATITAPGQDPLVYTRHHIVTVKEAAPDLKCFTGTVTTSAGVTELAVEWNVANVTTVSIPEIGEHLAACDTKPLTALPTKPLPTSLSLSASNSAGAVTKTLDLTWATAGGPWVDGAADDLALSSDGTQLYLKVDHSIAVLDAATAQALCKPIVAGSGDRNLFGLTASHDGSRLYLISASSTWDSPNEVCAFDTSVFPPQPIGSPAPIADWHVLDKLPSLSIVPSDRLVIAGGSAITPIRTSSDPNNPVQAQKQVAIGSTDPDQSAWTCALWPDGGMMYALNIFSGPVELALIDLETWQVMGGKPVGLAFNAAGDGHPSSPASLLVTPDGSLYVYGSSGRPAPGVARLNPQPPFKVEATWEAPYGSVQGVFGSADGRVIYVLTTGGYDTWLFTITAGSLESIGQPNKLWDFNFQGGKCVPSSDGTRIYMCGNMLQPAPGYVPRA